MATFSKRTARSILWYATPRRTLFGSCDAGYRNLSFVSQQTVSGRVAVQLHPYRFELEGIRSDNDLMQAKFGKYGEMNTAWNAEEAKGFIKVLATASKVYHSVNKKL